MFIIKKYKILITIIFCLFLLCGCTQKKEEIRTPMFITPLIEGIGYCDEAMEQPNIDSVDKAIQWCINNGYDSSGPLGRTLESIEPGGAKGQVQVGYEVGISLLALYDKQDGEWKINEDKLNVIINTIINLDRPVIIYLMANHFDTKGALPSELSKNPDNLMLLKNGEPPFDDYFGNSVIPFTLLTDESIPVNHYRFEALRFIGKKISELPDEVKDRIVAVTLVGEVHHLYSDFTNGAGQFDDIMVTDYSPKSIEVFQKWLERKYKTIEILNNEFGSDFKDFSEIIPPSKNVHNEKLNFYTEHYDSYAAGNMTISGWMWDPKSLVDKLILYIDGKGVGEISQGYSRLDVYRAIDEVTDPNTGFKYIYDYRNLNPGRHLMQVVAQSKDELYLMAQAEFVVVDRYQRTPTEMPEIQTEFANFDELIGVKHWLDYPKPLASLYYNPLARDWNEYRDEQITTFMEFFYTLAVDSGIPKEKLYSHQILPMINSSWNDQLFMGLQSIESDALYKLGVNLYGGATNNKIVKQFLQEHEILEYGVPEFHIQQWKSKDVAIKALEFHFQEGAKFLSPYYISIIPDSLKPFEKNSLQIFNIRPDNDLEGSNILYDSIVEFANK